MRGRSILINQPKAASSSCSHGLRSATGQISPDLGRRANTPAMMGKIGGCLPPPPLGTETEKLVYVVNPNSLERAALGGYGASWSTEEDVLEGVARGRQLRGPYCKRSISNWNRARITGPFSSRASITKPRAAPNGAARSDGVSCQIRNRAGGLVLHGDQIGKVNPLFIRGQIVAVSQVEIIAWHAD